MAGRADRIYFILQQRGGRLSVQDVRKELAKFEKLRPRDLNPAIVTATVVQDNNVRASKGQVKRFRTYGDGDEEWGYISLVSVERPSGLVSKDPYEEIPVLLEQVNSTVRQQLKEAISRLTWQQFESNFLTRVLEALGFEEVEITKRTRDGGRDATCNYKRGLVRSQAIVSAKHWKTQTVGRSEVQRLRGIKGPADTAIIVTSSRFTPDAIKEAEPSQNQRAVVLIDGELIAEACILKGLGIEKVPLPTLFRLREPLLPEEEERQLQM